MNRSTLAAAIAEVTAQLSRPRFLRVRAVLHIHDRRTTRGHCPCCDSPTAEIAETLPVADLILDLLRGDRIEASDVTPEVWDELCELAHEEHIQFRCSRHQAPLILDESPRHLFASGGNRSAKTTCALIWMAIQWLQRGGKNRRFWLVAPTTPKSFELLSKLFNGTGESPPILPRSLIEYSPSTHRASNLQTVLVDGSLIDLKFFEGDPGAERLKSNAIIAAVVDEAAHMKGLESLVALQGRCVDAGGRLFLASTPMPESFLKKEVVDFAMAFERLPPDDPKRTDGTHQGSRWYFAQFPMAGNPWIPLENIERELKALDPDSPQVARDFYGSWVSSTGPLWTMYDPEVNLLAHEARSFGDLGQDYRQAAGAGDHVDITSECVTLLFGGPSPHYRGVKASNRRYLMGCDVNCHPMSSVVCQVTAPADDRKNRDKWHVWVFDVVRTVHGNSFAHVEEIASAFFGRVMSPGSKTSPLAGCGVIIDAKALGRDPTAHRFGGDPTGIAELFGRRGLDCRSPRYISVEKKGRVPVPPPRWDCFLLMQRFMKEGRLHISNGRGQPLLDSLILQQDSGNGWDPKKNDALASPIDACRYLLWALAHAPAPATIRQ